MYSIVDLDYKPKIKPHYATNYLLAKVAAKNLANRYKIDNIQIKKEISKEFPYIFGSLDTPNVNINLDDTLAWLNKHNSTLILNPNKDCFISMSKDDADALKFEIERSKKSIEIKYDGLFHKIHTFTRCLCLSKHQLKNVEFYIGLYF